MELREVQGRRQKWAFIDFVYSVYRGDPCFKDSLIPVLRTFLYRSDSFTRQSIVRPVAVQAEGQTRAQCIFVYNQGLPALQVSFFEALPAQVEAVELLLREARAFAARLGLGKLVVGLNGHVSYGVGLLCEPHDRPISFDSAYTPRYYLDYFARDGFRARTLQTYQVDSATLSLDAHILERTNRRTRYRLLRWNRFDEDVRLFGELCNRALEGTPLFFPRDPRCMVELLKPLRPFLSPKNLIFALREDREVGFVFWHPDYNELFRGGQRNSLLRVWLAWLTRRRAIQNVKLNVIGVLPRYRGTGLSLGLVGEAYRRSLGRFRTCETNFVFSDNLPSRRFNETINDGILRTYRVYEADVQER